MHAHRFPPPFIRDRAFGRGSRSEALVWAVRLVGSHADEWLTGLRAAMASVEEVRARGPR